MSQTEVSYDFVLQQVGQLQIEIAWLRRENVQLQERVQQAESALAATRNNLFGMESSA